MVLENKLHLTDSTELARQEEKISKQKAAEMFARYYERCHINYVNKRLPYARKAYNYFVNSQYTD